MFFFKPRKVIFKKKMQIKKHDLMSYEANQFFLFDYM